MLAMGSFGSKARHSTAWHSMVRRGMAQHGTALPGTARTAARGEELHGAAAVQTELVFLAEKRCRSRPCVFSTGELRAPTADGEGDPDQVPCSSAPRLSLTPPVLHPQAGASPGTPHISGGSSWQPRPWQLLGVPEPRRHRCHCPTVRTRSQEPPASWTQRDRTGQQEGLGTREPLRGPARWQPTGNSALPRCHQPRDAGRDWMRHLAAPRRRLWDAVEWGGL